MVSRGAGDGDGRRTERRGSGRSRGRRHRACAQDRARRRRDAAPKRRRRPAPVDRNAGTWGGAGAARRCLHLQAAHRLPAEDRTRYQRAQAGACRKGAPGRSALRCLGTRGCRAAPCCEADGGRMSLRPSWSYVQARLQARHGERLTEGDWRVLEAVRSPDHFIDRARATALRRFSERLNTGMSSHAIERELRNAWRDYVAEVASWCPPDWRPAILWCAPLADLPSFAALLRGEAPRWAQQDAALAAFLELAQDATIRSPLDVLLPGPKREPTLAGRWYAHWRSLWPQGARECRALTALADTVKAHVVRLD